MAFPRISGRRAAAALCGAAALLVAATPCVAADRQGFLYGRVTTEKGTKFEGRLRWGNEEAFWGDFFNGTKEDRPYADEMPEVPRRREPIRIFGITVGVRWKDSDQSRVFKARFGDIRRIRVRGGDSASMLMKSGTEYEIGGGSNDLGGTIQIWDAGIGKVELDWSDIETIEFLPTPKTIEVEDFRLHGTVKTSDGEFRGYVQWDQDECVSSDKLDGSTTEAKLSIEMGRIRSIARRTRNSSSVTLRDGRELVLDDSNDVDSGNRGIFVDDSRYGRVLVTWDAFERVDFSEPGDSGPSYASFGPGKPLNGKVTDRKGGAHTGQIVYDLDESETWELLDGNRKDVEYTIPMGLIASIVPQSGDSSLVILRNGEEVELEDTVDTGKGNAGILVLEGGRRKAYLPWDEVKRVDFGD